MEVYDLSGAVTGDELKFYPSPENAEIKLERMGMVTGSQFGKLVKKDGKKGFILSKSQTASDLLYKVAWERLLKLGNISNGLGRMNFTSKSVEHGHDFEQEAIVKYMCKTGREVDNKQQFIVHDDYIGGTPDGYIGDDGIIEVKCPWNGGNHIKSMLTGKIYNEEYTYQIQGYLWITGRKWCDFVTYDPDLHEKLQLNIIHVDRDEEIIKGIHAVMSEVKSMIISIMNDTKLQ